MIVDKELIRTEYYTPYYVLITNYVLVEGEI